MRIKPPLFYKDFPLTSGIYQEIYFVWFSQLGNQKINFREFTLKNSKPVVNPLDWNLYKILIFFFMEEWSEILKILIFICFTKLIA